MNRDKKSFIHSVLAYNTKIFRRIEDSENVNMFIFKHLKELMRKVERRQGDELVKVVNEKGMLSKS